MEAPGRLRATAADREKEGSLAFFQISMFQKNRFLNYTAVPVFQRRSWDWRDEARRDDSWLRDTTDLQEDLGSVPRPLLWQLTTTITPALGARDIRGHRHSCAHAYT